MNNRDLQFYLVAIQQMKDEIDLKYQLFIVLRALEDSKIVEDNEKDIIYDRLFNYAHMFY